MILNSLEGIKYVSVDVSMNVGGNQLRRQVFKVTRRGQVLGYVARSLGTGAPRRRGWSYALDEPELFRSWNRVGPGSTRELATDHLLSMVNPSAVWLV